jgi:hypothetical protein
MASGSVARAGTPLRAVLRSPGSAYRRNEIGRAPRQERPADGRCSAVRSHEHGAIPRACLPPSVLRRLAPPDFPRHDIPDGVVPARLTASTGVPPLGEWRFCDPRPSPAGWHVACPCCLGGRVLLRPDPRDPWEYEMLPDTCSGGCDPYSVARWWFVVRMGEPQAWWDWLARDHERRARR